MNPEDQPNENELIFEIDTLLNKGEAIGAVGKLYQAMETGISIAPYHVCFARKLTLCAQWQAITALLPEGSNMFMSSGWLQSILKSRPINDQGDPVPWFTYPAIDFLDTVIDENWKVFEWGGGYSTIWWANKVRLVTAIENDGKWHEELRNQLPDNARLQLIEQEKEYVSAVSLSNEQYDVIVVDGSHRNDCTKIATRHIKDSGILIFDNSDVSRHQAAQRQLKEEGFYRIDFWGLIPSYHYKNCTSIYFKDPDLLKPRDLPHEHVSSVGLSCSQAMEQNEKNHRA